MNIRSFIKWAFDRTMGTYFALSLLVIFGGVYSAFAITSFDVANLPQMYLDVSITATSQTGIILAAPSRNGIDVIIPTTTGGILRFRQGFRVEDIYFASATVNQTTKKVTLAGVLRDICFNTPTTIQTCSAGHSFARGAVVELSNDARLFNLKANIDRVNTFIGSGQLTSNQITQAFLDANSVTSTQRDAFSFVNNGNMIYNSTLGVMQYRGGGGWISFGSGATVDASTTVSGKSELATVADMSGSTVIVGDSLSRIVLGTDMVIRRSTGVLSVHARNKLAETNNIGMLSGSLIGLRAASGDYLRFKGEIAGIEWEPIQFMVESTNSGSFIIADNGTGNILNVTSDAVSYFQIKDDKKNGHIRLGGGTAPTLSGCGGASIAGNDTIGRLTMSTTGSQGCKVIFNKPYDLKPTCAGAIYARPSASVGISDPGYLRLEATATGMVLYASIDIRDNDILYMCFEY